MKDRFRSHRASRIGAALFLLLLGCDTKELPAEPASAWPKPLAPLAKRLQLGEHPNDCQPPCGCLDRVANSALSGGAQAELLEALPKLDEACRKDSVALGVRAEALARQERWAESESAAESATRSEGSHPFAHFALALGALHRMSMKEAEAATQRAEKDSRGPEVHRAYGQIALARGKFVECSQHFAKLAKALPTDVEATFNRGICEANAHHYKNAREAFLKTLQLNPKHAQSRLKLAILTSEIGAWDEAAHHLEAYAKLTPDDPRLPALREAVKTQGNSIPEKPPLVPRLDPQLPGSQLPGSGGPTPPGGP